ncbi:YbhB/YbcL family Raf kinase inhibitor-like protein [Kribbella turkmenica]|uniref:YbhB/YbcL family Raf kinase inhibitor-like protein n=1 Tax=Kribbella turkmenica TaxID=2530375 RepID=A0A4R4WMJ7_9ACTN|nr:YbhB/YbcL family Raf kinase inhibitor-like protein [Kribbella turkmenica]TDD16985.1 YbhB/YbcL family Raf kinase inhibitor-like protein [Kribbella turkmenica]
MRLRLLPMLTIGLGLTGCGGTQSQSGKEPAVPAPSITVTSRAFVDGGDIPRRFTCDGDDVSPPLAWKGLPEQVGAVALVVDDPDAPRGTFTHWVLLDLEPVTTTLPENEVPAGAKQAKNSAGRTSYFGPCPPRGTHHYRFTVYALSEATGLPDGAVLEDALHAIDSRTLARGRLTGLYSR